MMRVMTLGTANQNREAQVLRTKASMLLWIVQGLLALTFLFAGGTKLVLPLEVLTAQQPLPGLFVRLHSHPQP